MQDELVDQELAGADQALQQLRQLNQALQTRLNQRVTAEQQDNSCLQVLTLGQQHQPADGNSSSDGNSSRAAAGHDAPSGPVSLQDGSTHPESQDSTDLLQCCQYSGLSPSCSSSSGHDTVAAVPSSSTASIPKPAQPQAPKPSKPPAWKQQVQQEKQGLLQRQQQAAAAATARRQQQLAQQQAASWQTALPQLPFQVPATAQVSHRVTHKLHKSLSMLLRDAAAKQQGTCPGQPAPAQALPAAAGLDSRGPQSTPSAAETPAQEPAEGTAAAAAAAAAPQQQVAAGGSDLASNMLGNALEPGAPCSPTGSSSSSRRNTAPAHAAMLCQSQQRSSSTADSAVLREHSSQGGSSSRQPPRMSGSLSKQQVWAQADACTDAEVGAFLLEHWQQHHLETAAVVLQCAWRSRAARLPFARYMSKRHASVQAALQPAFLQWLCWAKAAAHQRRYQQQAVVHAWREILMLQAQLCSKVLKGLRRGVLSGDAPTLMMWRLCTSSWQEAALVRPSLGGMLASILMHKVPRMRQQECLAAWRKVCQEQSELRARAHRIISAALRQGRRQQLQQAVRFWRLYTACCICERLKLQLPVFPQSCSAFDAWLWHHERRRQLQQQAAGLAGRLSTLRCFVIWHTHVHKMLVMRAAWSGLLLHTPEDLLWGGVSAFKANWKEQQLHRRLLGASLLAWRDHMGRHKAVTAVRTRIKLVAEARHKAAGLAAFRRFCRMSQLMSAAAVLKLWHARPLALACMHAWLHDTLHATLYLCWWRWRRLAVARLRWRAALGMHMYRSHWLPMELAFAGWRKATAAAQQEPAGTQELLTAAAGSDTATGLSQETDSTPPAHASAGGSVPLSGPAGVGSSSGCGQLSNDAGSCSLAAAAELHAVPLVLASLADYPVGGPWRPLLQRGAVLAPQGLRRLTGLRLGRAVKDLRELEGGFITKDSDSGGGGLLCSRVFARAGVSPGLQAMATAQLPMNLLWRTSFPADAFWWQRVVGLVQHQVPHPDSWRALISNCRGSSISSTSTSSSGGSSGSQQPVMASSQEELRDLCDPSYSSAPYRCTCSRCPAHATQQAAAVAVVSAKPAADAAASMARSRLRLRAGLKLEPLQVPDASSTAATPAAATPACANAMPAAASDAGAAAVAVDACSSSGTTDEACSVSHTGGASVSSDAGSGSSTAGGSRYLCGAWPACWSCEDVAGLCRLVQAEELLETAVHLLLGVGADSSGELYSKLQQMTRGQQLDMQGDLLAWQLSAALAHDSAANRAVLARARARDELLVATMELRERAMALHLHIPHRFTLNTKRERVDARAAWAAIMARVEQERDWDNSSEEDAYDPREQAWAALVSQHQQLPQQLLGGTQQPARSTPASPVASATGGACMPDVAAAAAAAAEAQQPAAARPAGQQAYGTDGQPPPGLLGTAAAAGQGAQAAVMALAAAAAAGVRLGPAAPAALEHLAPGMLLSQSPIPAGEAWSQELAGRPQHASRSQTPAGSTMQQQQQQQQVQLQLDAAQQAAVQEAQARQEAAKVKQEQQHRRAMAAAQGLFGKRAAAGVAGSGSTPEAGPGTAEAVLGQTAAMPGSMPRAGAEAGADFFAGHSFFSLPSLSNRSGAAAGSVSGRAALCDTLQQDLLTTQQQVLPGSRGAVPVSAAAEGPSGARLAAGDAVVVGLGGEGGSSLSCRAGDSLSGDSGQALRNELQGILTELLTPVLGVSTTSAAAAAAAAEGGAVMAQGVGADAAGGLAGSGVQGAMSTAECLADACAEGVLQPQHQQQQVDLLLQEHSLRQLPVKPHSAPCTALAGRERSGLTAQNSSSSSSSGDCSLAGGQSFRRRAISAAVGLTGHSLAAGCAAAGAEAGFGLAQEASWRALAVQQGLLEPTGAAAAAEQWQRQAGVPQHSPQAEGSSSGPGTDAQGSSQALSEGSSLPSVPSTQGFWGSLQQRGQPGGKQQGGNSAAASADRGGRGGSEQQLLPIGAAARSAGGKASGPAAAQHVQQQQQQKPQSDVEQPVRSWVSAEVQREAGGKEARRSSAEEPLAAQLLPQMATALQALQDNQQQQQQQHPCSTQEQQQQELLLQGLHQALSNLEPAQLQQQIQLLLQAQKQSATAAAQQRCWQQQQQQQEQAQAVPILPWGGEMLLPEGVAAERQSGAAGGGGVGGAAAMLSGLLTASLSTRVAFWRQVTSRQQQQQGQQPSEEWQQQQQQQQQQQVLLQHWVCGLDGEPGSNQLAHQLHQLAWTSILLTSSSAKHGHKQQPQHAASQPVAAGPTDALRQQLHTYLAAHMPWRQQQQHAPALAPAEKWVTLEHEEQVLEFITSMTIAVHQQLLRKHLGLPPAAAHTKASSAAFGSSSCRDGAGGCASAAAAAAAAGAAAAVAALAATGTRVERAPAGRLQPTIPRKAPVRSIPVYTVPRPDRMSQPNARALQPERLEPLLGWATQGDEEAGMSAALPRIAAAPGAAQRPVSRGGSSSGDSVQSSASSWA